MGLNYEPHTTKTAAASVTSGPIEVDEEGVPLWVDRRFPMLFIGLGLVAAVGVARSPAERPVGFAVALVFAAILPWALSLVGVRVPDPAFAAVVIAPIGFLIIAGERLDLLDLDGGAPQLVLMLVIGIVGQMAAVGSVRLVTLTTLAAASVVVIGALVRGDALDFAPWAVGILLAFGGARAFRSSILSLAELRQAQQALADQYVSDERRRIAREVHDIVAHTMSVTMLHLTAARLALQQDPDTARQALEKAEETGRASMDDIRAIVRLLRTDESAVDAALPDDAGLPVLVERYREAGRAIAFQQAGDTAGMPPATRLAVYRVVQESLSNAMRHGAGEADVSVRRTDHSVEIEVVNATQPGRVVGRGTGLIGMQERVDSLGGILYAGPDGDARWRVHAKIPL